MIIGICGLIGSGKGTVADILVENHNFEKLSFADKLKDGVASVFGWDRDMLEGDTDRSRIWREKADVFWSNETGKEVTPRLVLQLFGTDCMRNGFFDGIWVSLVKQKILENPDKNWVIPDVRFPNEVKMIQSVQGQVWQVRRGELPKWFIDKRDNGTNPSDVHASEWAWIDKDSEFEQIIQNDGSLEDLLKKLQKML
ncbi:MAG: hypothetical protein CMQ75_02075 [Gammaproteobacteria bacterium]|nr:hypothetical protein [Gammaproteobacteria bacterium]|tara:strand:+ start:5585 stop:6175 length:591 start_codon:yes stop_codon:yes gene_type:complete